MAVPSGRASGRPPTTDPPRLFIDNVEFVDNAFKLLNIVVDVAFNYLLIMLNLLIMHLNY